ncbi:MAG: hypothetical protein O2840_00785 [bacterium]|nr:hypothetical protein [bacterium]
MVGAFLIIENVEHLVDEIHIYATISRNIQVSLKGSKYMTGQTPEAVDYRDDDLDTPLMLEIAEFRRLAQTNSTDSGDVAPPPQEEEVAASAS